MAAYRFAHFSDPHLPLEPDRLSGRDWLSKRALSVRSWRRKRRHLHQPAVLAALVADVRAAAPDHILVTGDLTNIALPGEFARARDWLQALGAPTDVTVIPGNHDTLVPVPWDAGLGQWRAWMAGDAVAARGPDIFPAVRIRGPVAFVGLNSGLPTPPLLATGTLGAKQLRRVEEALYELGRRGLFRVLMVHHPVAPGVVSPRKGLTDARDLRAVLARVGAEMVLGGHAHRADLSTLAGPLGPLPALTAPSASHIGGRHEDAARWHDVRVERAGDSWSASVTVRGWDKGAAAFGTVGTYQLQLPAIRAQRLGSLLSSAA